MLNHNLSDFVSPAMSPYLTGGMSFVERVNLSTGEMQPGDDSLPNSTADTVAK